MYTPTALSLTRKEVDMFYTFVLFVVFMTGGICGALCMALMVAAKGPMRVCDCQECVRAREAS